MDIRLIGIDAGTTNTRVYAMLNEHVLARAEAPVGVRDTARDGNSQKLVTTLRQLIERVIDETAMKGMDAPRAIVAAGMITSSLGLLDVPHRLAPVGMEEFVTDLPWHYFREISDVPFLLVPGVRSGPKPCNLGNAGQADLMRGEETLGLGMLAQGLITAPGSFLNLGSHWKWISFDSMGRIAGSWTTLSGELIHATQTQTILASAVPLDRPNAWDATWIAAGVEEQERSGLARALFTVRLLELSGQGSPDQRMAFLIGCYLGSDLAYFRQQPTFDSQRSVGIVGHSALATTWCHWLRAAGSDAKVIPADQVELSLLHGLHLVARAKLATGR